MVEIVKNSFFEAGIEDTLACYPKLNRTSADNYLYLAGEIDIIDNEGLLRDTYNIEIYPCEKFPYQCPYMKEVGGKIPRNYDWHVFEDTGYCCIKALPEQDVLCYDGLSLVDFVNKEAVPYLFNQTFRRNNGYFLKERSHGDKGNLEYYFELLKSVNIKYVLKVLFFAVGQNEPGRTAVCFCGSGIKYRKCHREIIRKLKKVNPDRLKIDIVKLCSLKQS